MMITEEKLCYNQSLLTTTPETEKEKQKSNKSYFIATML